MMADETSSSSHWAALYDEIVKSSDSTAKADSFDLIFDDADDETEAPATGLDENEESCAEQSSQNASTNASSESNDSLIDISDEYSFKDISSGAESETVEGAGIQMNESDNEEGNSASDESTSEKSSSHSVPGSDGRSSVLSAIQEEDSALHAGQNTSGDLSSQAAESHSGDASDEQLSPVEGDDHEFDGAQEGLSSESSDEEDDCFSYGSDEFEGILDDDDDDVAEVEKPIEEDSDLLKQILSSISTTQFSFNEALSCSSFQKAEPKSLEPESKPEPPQAEPEPPVVELPPDPLPLPYTPTQRSYSEIPGVPRTTPRTVPLIRNHLEEILVHSMCGSEDGLSLRSSKALPSPLSNQPQSTPAIIRCKTPLTSTPNQQQLPPDSPGKEILDKMSKRRQKIIAEILETERTYQQHLYLIVKCFEFPLRKAAVLSEQEVSSIFGNVRQILSLNQELMSRLEDADQIGRAFLQMAPFLKLYSMYANNHEKALATLLEWDQKCPEFSTFRRQQEELPEMHGLKLNALLITPVQRIPRYKLLLTDLLENTSPQHADYQALSEAVMQIGQVAAHINEHIKQQDNFKRMLQIQKNISGSAAPRLLTPGRVILKEGCLKKVSKGAGRSHDRFFYLFSDLLMYTKPRFLDASSSAEIQSQICCCVFPLFHCRVSRVFGNAAGQGALFSVSCKQDSVLLYSDHKTVDEWVEALIKAIRELRENRKSLRKSSSCHEHPPKTPKGKGVFPASPTTTLKRVLLETDVNCLRSPKRSHHEKKKWRRSRSFAGVGLRSRKASGPKTPEKESFNPMVPERVRQRYPSTPSTLDSLDQHEVIDLDRSQPWRYEGSTLNASTSSKPKAPPLLRLKAPSRPQGELPLTSAPTVLPVPLSPALNAVQGPNTCALQ